MPINTLTPARKVIEVTKSDTTEYANCRGVYVGTGGDLAVILRDQVGAVTIPDVPSGVTLPIDAKKIMSTNTTASGIRIFY